MKKSTMAIALAAALLSICLLYTSIQFAVQYFLSDPSEYLFNNRMPDENVRQAAETAIREVVGKSKMDYCLLYTSLIQSKRDVHQLPIDKIRCISSMLNMSCLAALLLAGSLSEEDMIEQFA